ncbi:MAG: dTMP kinase [Candidatus Woesearchaeota archaeon]
MKKGSLITLEGVEGSGKSTIINILKEKLEKDYDVDITREPGGSLVAEKIRNIIVNENIDAKTEALLFAAARNDHIQNHINPALKEGKIILCDRYIDSSLAYQGYGRKLGAFDVLNLNNFDLPILMPDLTLIIDIDPKEGLERIKKNKRKTNRLDNEMIDFYNSVRKGYMMLHKANPKRIKLIDGSKSVEDVINLAYFTIKTFLNS